MIWFRGSHNLRLLLGTAVVGTILATQAGVPAAQGRDAAEIIDIPNALLFEDRVLLGGQPTREDLERAVALGYRKIVNLRLPDEFSEWDEPELAESLGLKYVTIPVAGASGLTLENARRLAAELDQEDDSPIVLHCASGNRVGALLALKAFHFDGLDAQAALELGLENGLRSLESAVREYLRTKEDP